MEGKKDGYDLDGHFWSEHDDEESPSLICKYCDESFPVMKELMRHKKLKHIEKVDFCCFFQLIHANMEMKIVGSVIHYRIIHFNLNARFVMNHF